MLHEILLSLSGHPSPLLSTTKHQNQTQAENQPLLNSSILTPSEKALLSSLAHLSDLQIKISSYSSQIASSTSTSTSAGSSSSSSVICRAVATAIETKYLSSFREKVLQVEAGILEQDAHLVGAYNIVPLTAIVGEFEGWVRRMEWLWVLVKFMLKTDTHTTNADEEDEQGTGNKKKGKGSEVKMTTCTGAQLMDWLLGQLQTGYRDVEDTARGLVRVAETAWLRQVSAWILYGQLPTTTTGGAACDFFVQRKGGPKDGRRQEGQEEEGDEEYILVPKLLPSFVTPSTAASMLFIGRSLRQIRNNNKMGGAGTTDHLSTQLTRLSNLEHPIDVASLSRTVLVIRNFLSRTVLQKLLPLSRVLETLELLRDFFLLRRGDFAMALTQQADEKIRSRWRRADHLAAAAAGYDKRGDKSGGGLGGVVVKEGEVAAVLVRTWAAMGSMQGQHAEEDEGLELARDLIRLTTLSSRSSSSSLLSSVVLAAGTGTETTAGGLASIAPTPFRNLLFSVPVVLTMQIPSPLDLFLSQADLQTYTAINSYLLSLRRAHLRLTDLWKITSLRRHHPAPPGPPRGSIRAGRETVKLLRQRYTARSRTLRSAWATASAAIFFLCETEGYLQNEVVAGLSEGFHAWLTGTGEEGPGRQDPSAGSKNKHDRDEEVESDGEDGDDDDIWLATSASVKLKVNDDEEKEEEEEEEDDEDDDNDSTTSSPNRAPKDPQTLATAHRIFLRTLVRRLLLTHQSFTDPLYELLVHIDHLVALMHRLHSVWSAADLEADVGVVDAFVDLEKEEQELKREILGAEKRIKSGIEGLISELRRLEMDLPAAALVNMKGSLGRGRQGGDGAEGKDDGEEQGDELDDQVDMEEEEAFAMREMGEYVPRRVGGVDRLLMKLDFGSWFGDRGGSGEFGELDEEL